MVVLGGWAVSYERGAPAVSPTLIPKSSSQTPKREQAQGAGMNIAFEDQVRV
jgi:hypothetical protein